jgi:hypothetical protein
MSRKRATIVDSTRRLLAWFEQRGNLRIPNRTKQRRSLAASKRTGRKSAYRKGYEIRIAAGSPAEVRELSRLLRAAGFTPGKPFAKGRRTIVPVYGYESVERFAALAGINLSTADGFRKKSALAR